VGRESALRPRALIVEDEILIARGLKEEMRALAVIWKGFSSGTPFCFPLTSFRRFSFPLPVEPSTEEGLSYLYRRGAGPFATVLQRHE